MKWILKKLIDAYRVAISPFAVVFGGSCRFHPTCSEYASQAIDGFPPHRALAMIAWRILRCNPWCEGGVDRLPAHNTR